MNQKELTEWFSQQNIQEVEVIVPDIAGVARGKLVPEDKFLNDSAIRLPESVFIPVSYTHLTLPTSDLV